MSTSRTRGLTLACAIMERGKRNNRNESFGPKKRIGSVRISMDIARRVREGHPWIYEEALRGRQLSGKAGDELDISDTEGDFVARALLDPTSPLRLRVFSYREGARLGEVEVLNIIERCARLRREATDVECGPLSCHRVLNGDSEGLPGVNVDRYADYLVISFYSPIGDRVLPLLIEALNQVWKPKGIYLQRRHVATPAGKPRPPGELVSGEIAPTEIIIEENGCRFAIDVTAPLGTGLFPDMRLGRNAVAAHSKGCSVINCFSYTGAFSIVAARAGAKEVVSVDTAARAHSRARRNCHINDLDEKTHDFITGDAFAAMDRFATKKRRFDLVILDPPTFSGSKSRSFTALKDYADLIQAACSVIEDEGYILAASNAAKMPYDDFDRALGRGANSAGCQLVVTERLGQPSDYPTSTGFPEGRYLKLVLAKVIR